MGLFDVFKSKNQEPGFKDLIWLNHEAKVTGYLKLLRAYPDAVWMAWFDQTIKEFQKHNQSQNPIHNALHVYASLVKDKTVIFLEHYPLRSQEEAMTHTWEPKKILVLSSLDEPLFQRFGGNNIIPLLEKMGADEEELLENDMISKSIENAQRKLEKHITVDVAAQSAAEWFQKNISINQL